MAEVIKGSDAAAGIKSELKKIIKEYDLKPCLAVIQAGNDESNAAYGRGIKKACDDAGIEVREYTFPGDISQADFEQQFIRINEDPEIHGILLYRPLPEHLDENRFAELIDPDKDMDCMSPVNWAKLAMGEEDGYYPCTAEAVIRICEYAGVVFSGAKAVVLGRSRVIGRPVGLMLLAKNATVTWCHSHTSDIPDMCRNADILISACGRVNMVSEDIASVLGSNCMAVDVGINFADGKMCGDFDFEAVSSTVGKITPVPGGVGSVTSSVMASHVVRAAYKAVYGN